MKKITFISISIVFLFLATSCKKTRLTGDKALYEGNWSSASYTTTLNLLPNGRASYYYSSGSVTNSIDNGRLIIEGSVLKIKMLISKKFHIDSPPVTHVDAYGDEYTVMTLDGEVYTKDY
jgi:hypothetical protein